jgi:hypothetical protein
MKADDETGNSASIPTVTIGSFAHFHFGQRRSSHNLSSSSYLLPLRR